MNTIPNQSHRMSLFLASCLQLPHQQSLTGSYLRIFLLSSMKLPHSSDESDSGDSLAAATSERPLPPPFGWSSFISTAVIPGRELEPWAPFIPAFLLATEGSSKKKKKSESRMPKRAKGPLTSSLSRFCPFKSCLWHFPCGWPHERDFSWYIKSGITSAWCLCWQCV